MAEELSIDEIIQNLANAEVQAARRPMTAEQFAALELSELEYHNLIDNCEPLTADELEKLGAEKNDRHLIRLLTHYNSLLRLKTDECPIAQGRPEREDTLLLVKQYQTPDSTWLPIPGAAYIFDRVCFSGYLNINAVHPLGDRDLILTPRCYNFANIEHSTRYRYHKYYNDADQEHGLNQEVNRLTAELREILTAMELERNQSDALEESSIPRLI